MHSYLSNGYIARSRSQTEGGFMQKHLILGIAVLEIMILPSHADAAGSILGTNLVINGDAEADTGSSTGDAIGPITGFGTTGNFTAVRYGASGGFPAPTDPGPTDRGNNFFAGGPSIASSSGSQLIDLAAASADIDAGTVSFDLSAYLGGFSSQGDNAVLTAKFFDANGSQLSVASIGPVSSVDRSGQTGLLFRATSGQLPAGTRFAEVTLQLSRTEGSYNDGYADDLSLILHPTSTTTSIFGTNLVVNGDAEADAGSPTGDPIGAIAGFSTMGNFTAVRYGASGGFPAATDPGPPDRGNNFFAGGPSIASSSGAQLIDLAAASAEIDAAAVSFDLSAYLGGFSSQGDNAALTVQFFDASGAPLSAASIGPVTSADRNGQTGLVFRETSGLVPAGTRSAQLTLQLSRTEGSYDDGYADDLSLVLRVSAASI